MLHKIGGKKDLKNYRAICLLSHYLQIRESTNPESRPDFGETTALQIIFHFGLLERARKYKLLLCLLFVDEKACNPFELDVMLRVTVEEGIDENYIEIVKEANTVCSSVIKLFCNPVQMSAEKRVRQAILRRPKSSLPVSRWCFTNWSRRVKTVLTSSGIVYTSRLT